MSDDLNQLNEDLDNRESLVANFSPGQIVGGKYKILSLLGRGGVGSVYLVEQVFLKQELALKVLDGKQILDDAQVRRFQMEAKAAHSLNHPNLVKVQDFGVLENEQPYLVMEYIKGVNLTEFIKANGTIKPQLTTLIFAQLCLGMSHAHQKSIIHRDIKPSNIMLSETLIPGTAGSAKIVDFGIAKLALDEGGEIQSLTRTGEIFGSPLYMSPEQCSGGAIDHRSDIYSFGCAMFEALTGTPPHLGTNPLRTMMMHVTEPAPLLREASLGTQFPESLERIVQKLLKKSPSERYQNFDDVAEDLSAVYSQDRAISPPKEVRAAKPAKTVTISTGVLSAYIGLALIGSSAVTAGVIYFSGIFDNWRKASGQRQHAVALATAAPVLPLASDATSDEVPADEFANAVDGNTAAKNAFNAVKKISSVIVTSGEEAGKRRFDFPNVPLGYVMYDPKLRKLAKDTQYLPAGIPLHLNIGASAKDAFNNPEIYHKLNPDDFTGLTIWPPASTEVEGTVKFSVKAEAAKLATIVSAFAKSRTVSTIAINGLMINHNTIESLDQMSNLRMLGIYDSPENEVVEGKHLQQISNFTLVKSTIANRAWRQLYGSANLKTLTIKNCGALPPDLLSGFRDCPKLVNLSLGGAPFENQWLDDLRQMHSLASITLKHIPLTAQQLNKMLDSCPRVKTVSLIGPGYENLSKSDEFKRNHRVVFLAE